MESFNFELKLISDIDRVANRGATALKSVQSQGAKTQKALNWGDQFGKQFEKVGFAAARQAKRQQDAFANAWARIGLAATKAHDVSEKRAAKAHEAAERRATKQKDAFANMWSKIGMAADRAHKQQARAFEMKVERRAEALREHTLGAGIGEGLGVGNLTKASFYGTMLAEGAFKFVDVILEGAHKIVDTFEEGISRAFEESSKQQTLRLGERLSLGSAGGKEFREDVGRFSKLTGFDDDAIRAMLLPLRRAGMNQQASRTAFAAATDVAAGEGRGGDAGRVQELLDGFQRIMLKGGIGEKQLVGLGVNVKPFYTEIAKQLKLGSGQSGIDAAKKRVEAGKIDPQLLLNTIYRGIEQKQGGKLGTGAIEFSKTFEAHLSKVKNLPNEYLKNLVDSPEFARANQLLGQILENLDPDSPAGQRIMSSVEHMFDRIVGFIGDPKDAADSLADKLEDAIGFAEELVDDFRSWADALLPSLETIEDMVFAARKLKAITSGDQVGLLAVNYDQARSDQKRNARAVEKQIRAAEPEFYEAALKTATMRAQLSGQATLPNEYGPVNMPPIEKAARADVEAQKNEMRKAAGIVINVHPGAVQVHGDVSDDSTHKEAGEKAGQHVVRELARAAQQGGG